MTNRSSIFGALMWVLVASVLAGSALTPVSAATRGCIKTMTSSRPSCATLA